jgi:hypothetical protein
LGSCASYRASSLNSPSTDVVTFSETKEKDIAVTSKAFNVTDCKIYLDRNVIAKGYQPIQLYIENNSDKTYGFSLNRISLSCARPEEVAEKVHTSTVGRAVGYGAGALLFWPLAIPAIVDGVKSSQANDALDRDFFAKAAQDQVILPHSHMNKLLFVPVRDYQPNFSLTLMEKDTNKAVPFSLSVN